MLKPFLKGTYVTSYRRIQFRLLVTLRILKRGIADLPTLATRNDYFSTVADPIYRCYKTGQEENTFVFLGYWLGVPPKHKVGGVWRMVSCVIEYDNIIVNRWEQHVIACEDDSMPH